MWEHPKTAQNSGHTGCSQNEECVSRKYANKGDFLKNLHLIFIDTE